MTDSIFFQIKGSSIRFDIPVDTVKQRRLSGTVSSQKPVDFTFLKNKIDVFQYYFLVKMFLKVFNHKFHTFFLISVF